MTQQWVRRTAAMIAGAGLLLTATPAAADDSPPAPPPAPAPGPPGLIPAIAGALAQSDSAPAGPFGLPDLSAYGANLLLGQNAAPAAPGSTVPAGIVPLSAFQSDYLVPQNLTPAAPGQGVAAPGLAPDADNPGTGRIAFLKRLHEMYAAGELKGALLGQNPKDWEPIPPTDLTAPTPAVSIPN